MRAKKDKVSEKLSKAMNLIESIEKTVEETIPTWEDVEKYAIELNFLSSCVAHLRLTIVNKYAAVECEAASKLLLKKETKNG